MQKLVEIVHGGLLPNMWNITIFYLYRYPYSQTAHQILTLDSSDDSRKGVILALVHIAAHLGYQNAPKTPILRAWIGIFQTNARNIETFIL